MCDYLNNMMEDSNLIKKIINKLKKKERRMMKKRILNVIKRGLMTQ